MLERLELCAADPDFWVEAAAGVAVFGSVDDLKVFKLRQPVPELLSVADRFQIKPLIRAVQWRGRYQLLALLVLAALPEHQRHFRMLSHNPLLIATGIVIDPGTLSPDELPEAAWQAVEPYFEERLRALVEAYGEASGHGHASDRLEEIATALAAGRVDTFLLEANRRIPGSIDAAEGTVLPYLQEPQGNGAASAGAADVLEELARAAVRTGTEVIVLEADRMPRRSGSAAVLRH